jgi:hypothetical protein
MVKRVFIAVLIVIGCGFYTSIFGQKPVIITLENPSFEDDTAFSHTPVGWIDCGFAGESPPDVQPNSAFGVTKPAFHDSTYIGMVVRDNSTWEAVGQRLKSPLLKNVKYTFSVYACQSEFYLSKSRVTDKDINYIVPAVIKIWGGNAECEVKELLAQSGGIDFKEWRKLEFTLSPKHNYRYLLIEAYYIRVFKYVYNGNILIDNASAIVPILDKN